MPRLLPCVIGGALGALLLASPARAQAETRRPVTFPSLPYESSSRSGGGGRGALGAFRPFVGFELETLRGIDDGHEAPEDTRIKGLMLTMGGRYTFFIPDVQKIRPFVRGTLRAGAVGQDFSMFSVKGDYGATHYEGIAHAGVTLQVGPFVLEPFVGGAYNQLKPTFKVEPPGANVGSGSETQLQYGFAAMLNAGDAFGIGANFLWKKGEYQTGVYNRYEISGGNWALFWEHRLKSAGRIDLPADASAGKRMAVSMPIENIYGLTVYF